MSEVKKIRSPRYYDDIVKQYIIDNWDRIAWRPKTTEFNGLPEKIMKQELPQIPRNRFRSIIRRKYCDFEWLIYTAEQYKQVFGIELPKRYKGNKFVPIVMMKQHLNEAFRQKYCPDATYYPPSFEIDAKKYIF
jgi:hypothetical protein